VAGAVVSFEQAAIASATALIRAILRIQPPEMVPSVAFWTEILTVR
jgi:hypothetical protein